MDVSTEYIRKITEELCKFENRHAGTDIERKAAEFLKGVLSEIGLDVEKHEFSVLSWECQESNLNLVKPEAKSIYCALFPNSPSVNHRAILTSLESKPENSENLPVYGIAEWGESLWGSPSIPYNEALDRGLDGLIISSPDKGDFVKVRVGMCGNQLQIPILGVSRETGQNLRKMMENSEVIIDVECVAKRQPSTSRNLESIIEGSDLDFDIVISAHYDAFFSGAADNAAPVAIVVEAARQLLAHVQQGGVLRRTIRFLLYGSEEFGSEGFYFWMNGSRNYVENQENLEHLALVLSLDSLGYASTNYVAPTYELMGFAQSVASSINEKERFTYYSPPGNGSDHWFFTVSGVPTIYLISWPSPLYHTQKDIPENLDFDSISAYAEYVIEVLVGFANSRVLPLDIMALIEHLREKFKEFSNLERNPFRLQEVIKILNEILEYNDALKQFSDDVMASGKGEELAQLNDFLLASVGKLNRTIGQEDVLHEASYLSSFELIKEYVKIESAIRALDDSSIMKIHPRTIACTRKYDDPPRKLMNIAGPIIELKSECDKIAEQIAEELEEFTNHLDEILYELRELLNINQNRNVEV